MEQLFVVAFIAFFVLMSVLYFKGGSIFNSLFQGSKMRDRRAEMTRTVTWTGPGPADAAISRLKSELALESQPAMMSFKYTLKGSSTNSLLISYGKKMAEAFLMRVETASDGAGHTGRIDVPNFLEADGMPVHTDKMVAMRERIMRAMQAQGATFS